MTELLSMTPEQRMLDYRVRAAMPRRPRETLKKACMEWSTLSGHHGDFVAYYLRTCGLSLEHRRGYELARALPQGIRKWAGL